MAARLEDLRVPPQSPCPVYFISFFVYCNCFFFLLLLRTNKLSEGIELKFVLPLHPANSFALVRKFVQDSHASVESMEKCEKIILRFPG